MSISNNIINFIKSTMIIYKPVVLTMQFFNKTFVSNEGSIKYTFKKRLNRPLNLDNPILYNDKLQWLKLYWRDDLAVICADKYVVRNFVEEKIGKEYLNDFYGIYDSSSSIDFIICRDKLKLDYDFAKKKLDLWLKINYFYKGREWVYHSSKPRIISEKYLYDENGKPPMDYKIYCLMVYHD